MRILYFGSYKPSYPRNKVILDGLRKNGVEVIECRVPSGKLLPVYIRLLFRYLALRPKFDVMIVGFPGQEIMFLARLLTRKPIIFDVFTSHYMGYILDRKYFSERSWRSAYYRFLDRWSCKLADMVILDTDAHIKFFVREFRLQAEKFVRIWLGANTELHQPTPKNATRAYTALFWGSFIPLQGVEYIIRAAKILENEPIKFYLVGHGQTYMHDKKLAEELNLRNVHFLGRLPDEVLVDWIRKADVCLGTFSDSVKADITIQNKIFESLASKKPIITEETSSLKELLHDGQGVLFCEKADPSDLAKKIIKLKNSPELSDKIAGDGYTLFTEKLTPKKIVQDLILKVNSILSN